MVTLDTLHWYYGGPEPTEVARRYNERIRIHESISSYLLSFYFLVNYSTFFTRPSLCNGGKQEEGLHKAASCCEEKIGVPKKPKVTPESAIELKAETKKIATLLAQGRGKGLMMGHVPIIEKPPILFCEDSRYVFE